MDATAIFMEEIAKTAKIFGAVPSEVVGTTHPGVSPELREKAMEQYVREKAKEAPTGKLKSMLISGGVGGLAGLPFFFAGPLAGLMGTGLGVGLGSLSGYLAGSRDESRIEQARRMLNEPAMRKQIMGDLMASAERMKTRQLSPARAVLLAELLRTMDRKSED